VTVDTEHEITLPEAMAVALAERFGSRFTVSEAVRAHHGRGQDQAPMHLPAAVVYAHSTADVVAVLALADLHHVPVTAFGAGSSLEQQVTPVAGGLSLDLSQMDEILEVSVADMDCLVQPGVSRHSLNAHLRDCGLFMPVDPGAHCTIGGMCATRASGTNAVRYGTIRENVLGLEVVLAGGRVIQTGSRARKAANGYDLTHLLIGSEGTLGVITKVRMRLHGIPEATAAASCSYPTLADAISTVVATLQYGVPIARVEIMDAVQAKASADYSKLDLPASTTLFFEFHGTPASVREQADLVAAISADHGGGDFASSSDPDERARLWRARHDAYWAAMAIQPGYAAIPTDVCVPISQLSTVIDAVHADIAKAQLICPITGHVGDGNFHVLILYDPDKPDAVDRAHWLDGRVVSHAMAAGGTCSGEHGIGLGKARYMAAEHGEDALDAMRAIKRAFDPNGILNPGKIFDVNGGLPRGAMGLGGVAPRSEAKQPR